MIATLKKMVYLNSVIDTHQRMLELMPIMWFEDKTYRGYIKRVLIRSLMKWWVLSFYLKITKIKKSITIKTKNKMKKTIMMLTMLVLISCGETEKQKQERLSKELMTRIGNIKEAGRLRIDSIDRAIEMEAAKYK